jgi:23S rRNA pseudouridine1911/1915/1917 synthase
MTPQEDHEILVFRVEPEAQGERLDKWLSTVSKLSRSHVQKLLDDEMISCDDKLRPASYKLKGIETVIVQLPEPEILDLIPESMPLEICYEDDQLMVINKPRHLVVHPAVGNWTGTLVNGLLAHTPNWPGINGVMRPGIVHRLDKDTSGLLVVAKTELAQISLSEQIRSRQAKRLYLTLTWGNWNDKKGFINAPVGRNPKNRQKMAVVANGKEARSDYEVITSFPHVDFLKVQLQSGRTHQIRVHMSYINHPVVGDQLYSTRPTPWQLEGQALHAFRLGFNHPTTGDWLEFTATPPSDFIAALKHLGYTWKKGETDLDFHFINGPDSIEPNHTETCP